MRLKFVSGRARHGHASVRKGGQPPSPPRVCQREGMYTCQEWGWSAEKEKEREKRKGKERKDELDGCVRARGGRRHVRCEGKGRVMKRGAKGRGQRHVAEEARRGGHGGEGERLGRVSTRQSPPLKVNRGNSQKAPRHSLTSLTPSCRPCPVLTPLVPRYFTGMSLFSLVPADCLSSLNRYKGPLAGKRPWGCPPFFCSGSSLFLSSLFSFADRFLSPTHILP
jgi:hypothetical protein